MMRQLRHSAIVCLILGGTFCGSARADIVVFTDFGEWQDAVGPFSTLNFDEFPEFTHITDHYSSLGVTFTDAFNATVNSAGNFPDDDWGLETGLGTTNPITLVFDDPQLWIGVLLTGGMEISLYSGDVLIDSIQNPGSSSPGSFFGLVSDTAFDSVEIFDPADSVVLFDDLVFGVPAPGALALFGLGALAGVSNRRKRAS